MTQQDQSSFSHHLYGVSEHGDIRSGKPLPLGAHLRDDGVNFAIFSRHATRVRLELFARPEDQTPQRAVELNAPQHRTGDIWHVWVRGVGAGQLYAYRIEGPYQPAAGHRFNPHKLLLDPYATAITRLDDWDFALARGYDPDSPQRDLSISTLDSAAAVPRCVVTDDDFDWQDDRPLRHPWAHTVIYETHVRGFTIHPSAGVVYPGTYRGLIEKIPYLTALGVTAVELLPVQEFNPCDLVRVNPLTGERLKNYWGYNPAAFFAPNSGYSSSPGMGQHKLEFKQMVRALHRAGIEVILDVVFNHTAEGNELGPTICWRGIDNRIFYMLAPDRRFYRDYTGTGNTVNANHPVVQDMILDALRYWVMEMHIDGFRCDLAAVLGRDAYGNLLPNAPVLERIAEDPILSEVKLIAEAWDAGGAYLIGRFSHIRWAEWNGRYRDEVRRFWRGDAGMLGQFASRICGSADIYQHHGKDAENSINFITCHDGFTLNDLVSYRFKHNEANGEYNRDGMDENYSENFGAEGETDDPVIEAQRVRQIKNFLLTLLISRGVPMLLGGDEFRRTQRGNNNAYCQDNPLSWYDWSLLDRHQEIHRFARLMVTLRRTHPVLSREEFYTDADIRWFDPSGAAPSWFDPSARCLACLIIGRGEPDLFLMFNAGAEARGFTLPPRSGPWGRCADTALPPPHDIAEGSASVLNEPYVYPVMARSCVILATCGTDLIIR